MPSAAGKRVGRVLAGCSKPEARDKPGLYNLARYTRLVGIPSIGQQRMSGWIRVMQSTRTITDIDIVLIPNSEVIYTRDYGHVHTSLTLPSINPKPTYSSF